RFWANTSVASGNGGTLTRLLGYEWDSDLDNGFRPAGLIDMSSTTENVNTLLLDNGATTGPGTATHSLTLYRDTTSGALVFVGGRVAGVEVSTDGGTTWHPAVGTANWSYTWTAAGPGTHVIEARATDDSVNLQSSPTTLSVNVTGSSGPSFFTASDTPVQTNLNDGSPLEVGVKFTSSVAGQITALKFYRSAGDTGPDLLDLWTSTGTKLA